MNDRMFSVPVSDWLELDPNKTVEIGIAGPYATRMQHELASELNGVDGLEIRVYGRKSLDIPQLIFLAGSAGGIMQGIDILWQWYITLRNRDQNVDITVRTVHGQVRLTATTMDEARRLLDSIKALFPINDQEDLS